jgi:hypothetical protein
MVKKRKGRVMKSINILLLLLCAAVSVNGATPLYVSLTGNDANDGYTPQTAKATLAEAINVAVAGQKIIVQDGDYAISSMIEITKDVHVVSET